MIIYACVEKVNFNNNDRIKTNALFSTKSAIVTHEFYFKRPLCLKGQINRVKKKDKHQVLLDTFRNKNTHI